MRFLFPSRQRAGLLEHALELSDRSGPARGDGLLSEDVLDAHAEGLGEARQHVGARRCGGGLPEGDGLGRNVDELGELGLAELGRLTQSDEAGPLFGPWFGETSRHAGIVRVHFPALSFLGKEGLATYLVYQVQVGESNGATERQLFA